MINDHYLIVGIIPLIPISVTVSPFDGSHLPSATISFHSKLLLVENETSITMSFVSFPVMTSFPGTNAAVTTQDPAGMGEVANKGFTTVVDPSGAWPEVINGLLYPPPLITVSNPQ